MNRRIALWTSMYKGIDPEVVSGLVQAAFALGRRTNDCFAFIPAIRKRAELAANEAAKLMEHAESETGERFTHVVWMDDDIQIEPDTIIRLLDCIDDDHPVVFALAFERDGQHKPAIWRSIKWNGKHQNIEQIFEYPPDELIRVHAAGLCCAAWDREVLTALKKPYFTWQLPGYGRSSVTPDGFFCGRLHAKGIPVFCHTGIKVGHMTYPLAITERVAMEYKDRWQHTEHHK